MLAAALLPFIAVAADHWSLELRGGLRDVRSGGKALHVVMEQAFEPQRNYAEVVQPVNRIVAGEPVTASVWRSGEDADVRLVLVFVDAGGKPISSISTGPAKAARHWRQLRVSGRAPANAAALEFSIQVHGAGYASFDDAAISAGSLANPDFEQGWPGWRMRHQDGRAGLAWINDVPFVPWGLNYDRTILNGKDLLLEETPIEKIDRDFRVAAELGANAVRLFVQSDRFMPEYMKTDAAMFEFFDQVVARARKHNLRIDLTGLCHFRANRFPAWYNERSDDEVIRAERYFWEAFARRYGDEPAILMYDLQNEPFIAGGADPAGGLPAGAPLQPAGCLGPFCYVNRHFREAHPETPAQLAHRWTKAMVDGIRRYDTRHPITIGLLPGAAPVSGQRDPGFNIPAVADLLDILAIHLYPDHAAPEGEILDVNQDWTEMVLRYASAFNRPLIVEEWFPLFSLRPGPANEYPAAGAWFPRFMRAARGSSSGAFTFYHVYLVDMTEPPLPPGDPHVRQFYDDAGEKEQAAWPPRTKGTIALTIDAPALWRSPADAEALFERYRDLRRRGEVVDFTSPALHP